MYTFKEIINMAKPAKKLVIVTEKILLKKSRQDHRRMRGEWLHGDGYWR